MPQLWFGSDHVGNDHTVLAKDWISFTVPRPTARLCMNGQRPFVVKKVAWKTCAAPMHAQKMYGRISNADGSVFDNSYIGNTTSWQKAASTIYEYQSISMHFADDGGGKLRAWLVSGGPFYFSRKTGSGTIQTAGNQQHSGTPVGWIGYAQVALPPVGLKVARDAEDPNKVNFTWTPWDVKKDIDAVGDTYAVSGYVVQVAKDALFTDSTRLLYVAKGVGEAYGLFSGYDWYFRIATRNEVSEHYKLPGGIWSDAVRLVANPDTPALPSSSSGTPASSTETGAVTDVDDGGSLSDNNGSASSNQDGDTTTVTEDTTVETTEEVVHGDIRTAKSELSKYVSPLAEQAQNAQASPTTQVWNTIANLLVAISSYASQLASIALDSERSPWVDLVSRISAARTAATTAATAATGAQTSNQQIDSVKTAAKIGRDAVYDAVVKAKAKSTTATWTVVLNKLKELAVIAARAETVVQAGDKDAWTKARTATNQAATTLAAAVKKLPAAQIEKAREQALDARHAVDDAIAATTSAPTDYSAAYDAIYGLSEDIGFTLEQTNDTETVTKTVVVPGGTTVPGGSGSGTTGGSTPIVVTNPSTTVTEKIINWTPIPDTSALRERFGGLLVSKQARDAPGHVAYLMDRGGRQRLWQFKDPSRIDYNRIRDDQSLASVTFDAKSIKANEAGLAAMAVGRHELCIYRGPERVWEGPITLATFKRDTVELRAHDVTHYLNRTVMKNNYSNAYPKLDYVVNRIAGIIVNELGVKESLDPPINLLPYLHAYVESGDARTTRETLAAEATVWQHLDDLAAKAGIDYTVIGRALHIWDTSRPALGRIRVLTENDFQGDTYIVDYGMETATQTFVSDGQGNYGQAGGVDDFYGEIDLLATAYDENGNAVNQEDSDPTNDTIPIEEMTEQAERNLKGRNPTPTGLKIPDNSSLRMDRGVGLDVLVPGVYVPVNATLSGRTLNQMMKLKEVRVTQDSSGEQVLLTLTPASDSDEEATLEDS